MLREAFSRLIELGRLTLAGIARELSETLRRKEEARIYHWQQTAGRYPPRRTRVRDQGGQAVECSADGPAPEDARSPPENERTGPRLLPPSGGA